MKNYLEKFKQMVDELRVHPQIEITEFVINLPATEKEIKSTSKKFKLTSDMLDFYKQANGLTLRWKLKDTQENEEDPICGNIELLAVQDVFSDWEDNIYFDDDDEFKPLHPLDFFINEACSALYLDDSDNPEVYYHYCGEEMYPLKMDFGKYLHALLKTRGFWYWQTAVADKYQKMHITSPKHFKKSMPKLFPDFKLSEIL